MSHEQQSVTRTDTTRTNTSVCDLWMIFVSQFKNYKGGNRKGTNLDETQAERQREYVCPCVKLQ